MNKWTGIGRLSKDPDVRYSTGEKSTAVARFTLATDRKFKKDGEPNADFINCIAFGKTAEVVEKWVHKGTKVAVIGHIQTGSYTNKDGQKVYTTDVMIEEVEFCESKGNNNSSQQSASQSNSDRDFMSIPDGIDGNLPFN